MWIEYPSEFGSARLDLAEEVVTIGRDDPCRIRLTDPSVSGLHAKVEPAAGGWFLTDFGSTNGTYLNGGRVLNSTPLSQGDVVTIGSVVLRVHEYLAADEPKAVASSIGGTRRRLLPGMTLAVCLVVVAIPVLLITLSQIARGIGGSSRSSVVRQGTSEMSVESQIRDLENAMEGSANVKTSGGAERDLARLYLALGNERRAKGRTILAEVAYRRVTELAPDSPDGHEALGRLYEEEAERTPEDPKVAETWSASADAYFDAAKVAGSIGEKWRLQEASATSGYKAALLMSRQPDGDAWRTKQVLELARSRAGSTMKIMTMIDDLHSQLLRREEATPAKGTGGQE